MTDFRNYNPRVNKRQQLAALNKRLILIFALGFPFILAIGSAVPAYFDGSAIFPFLEQKQNALWLMVIGGAGLVIETIFSLRTISQINRLKQEIERSTKS